MAIELCEFKVLPPSKGEDNNWHVVDSGDTMVAHCFGYCHSVAGGEELARRIAACLNACSGIETADLADGVFTIFKART